MNVDGQERFKKKTHFFCLSDLSHNEEDLYLHCSSKENKRN